MPCHVPLRLRAFHGLHKVRRIRHDGVKTSVPFFRCLPDIKPFHLHPVRPGRTGHVFTSLLHGRFVNIDGGYKGIRIPLGQHQGNQSASGTNVKHPPCPVHLCPCADQHAVGAYLHGTFIMKNYKLLELKIWIWHNLCLKIYAKNSEIPIENASTCHYFT